ncbi:LysR substrate-binding domain-containing protein [Thalassotalea ganghwensis]
MTKNLDIDLLRSFIAVVDNGSTIRAAAQIHRSQSAISMQIKRLESFLDYSLFERHHRQLQLTAQGKQLVSYARRLLALNDQAVSQLTQSKRQLKLRVGCPDDYTAIAIPRLITLLKEHQPDIEISIFNANSGALRRAMDNDEIDLAILTRSPESNEGHFVYQEKGVWVANNSDAFLQKPLPLVLFEESCKFHSQVIDSLDKKAVAYQIICTASHITLLQDLVRSQGAVSVLPSKAASPELIYERAIDGADLPVVDVVLVTTQSEQHVVGWQVSDLARALGHFINQK